MTFSHLSLIKNSCRCKTAPAFCFFWNGCNVLLKTWFFSFSPSQLCDFQSVLSTEDEKKIRHLDHLYEVRHVNNGNNNYNLLSAVVFHILCFSMQCCSSSSILLTHKIWKISMGQGWLLQHEATCPEYYYSTSLTYCTSPEY